MGYGYITQLGSRMASIENPEHRAQVQAFSKLHGSKVFREESEARALLANHPQCVQDWFRVTLTYPM